MLHELLLSLSGHPSPLLKEGSELRESLQTTISPAELALLASLAKDLGGKYNTARDNAADVSASHPSTVCRAVASAIKSVHLAAFQQRIIEVEKDILNEDASLVGAYNIVPLSALVGSFDGWGRKLEWLRDLVHFIQHPVSGASTERVDGQRACTAAMLIGRLRDSMHTGYPDIENLSLSLVKIAETAWLKQLSAWVLYGRHPGEDDFLITRGPADENSSTLSETYKVTESLLPPFVTPSAANSVLFIGKSLNHIQERQKQDVTSTLNNTTPELALLPAHLAQLSALQSPITSSNFSTAIGAIRLSLSQNALQKLLPMSKALEFLYVLKDFFLLERGDFAIALVTAADDRLNSRTRHGQLPRKAAPTLEDSLASMIIKEGEVHAVLARTWTSLASSRGFEDDEDIDEGLELARDLIRLSIKSVDSSSTARHRDHGEEKAPAFDDLLLPSSTVLTIEVPSPLDLFVTADDTHIYSRIHAYLLAIRRAHLRLTRLFLLSKLRRDHPCPRASSHLSPKDNASILERKRCLSRQRTMALRPAWAAVGSATFFLGELSQYLQSEVIQRSWTAFHSWLNPPTPTDRRPNSSSNNDSFNSSLAHTSFRPGSSSSASKSTIRPGSSRPTSSRASHKQAAEEQQSPHDPESLTQAHKRFLTSLTTSLLLDNATFTGPLRRLMTSIDHITALMLRLNNLQIQLDLEADNASTAQASSSHPDHHDSMGAAESQLLTSLHNSLPQLKDGITNLVDILRTIDDQTRLHSSSSHVNTNMNNATHSTKAAEQSKSTPSSIIGLDSFNPWSSRSLDRLLLKFDFKINDDI